MKNVTLISLLFLCSIVANAQNNADGCGTITDRSWESAAFNDARSASLKSTNTYTIPVVVHIIHEGGTENVADTFVHRLIDEINGRFANSGPYHYSDGNNANIAFCLAEEDTSGNPVTGITRDSTPASNMYMYTVNNGLPITYPVDSLITWNYHWNTSKYLNIYLVKNAMVNGWGYAGFAFYPGNHGSYRDGIFLDFDYTNTADTFFYRYGLIAHEAGHYLGLYHTYEGGCTNNNCQTDNDGVCDTPPDNQVDSTCVVNSCSTDENDTSTNNPFRAVNLGGLGDQPDDTRNFMDFGNCVHMFTEGQIARMQAALTTQRGSLLTSTSCGALKVAGIKKSNHFSVSPNPFTSIINLKTSIASDYSFSITNLVGTVVCEGSFAGDSKSISLADLPGGLYIYKIAGKNGFVQTGKLLKE